MFTQNQWCAEEKEEEYLCTTSFIVRLMNIIILLAAWICAAAALDNGGTANGDLQSTRIAFLVFALIAFVECILIFTASLNCIIVELLYIVLDAFMAFLLLIMSIAAAVRDTQVNNGTITGNQYRYGSLAAASVFGFISVVLFIELIILYIRSLIYEPCD